MATNNETLSENKHEGATLETDKRPSLDSAIAYPLQLQNSERYGGLFTTFTCMEYCSEAITAITANRGGISKDAHITPEPNGWIADKVENVGAAWFVGKASNTGSRVLGFGDKGAGRIGKALGFATLVGLSFSNKLSEADKKEIKCIIALPTPSITSDYSFSWSEPGEDVAYTMMINEGLSGGSGSLFDKFVHGADMVLQATGRAVNGTDVGSFTSGVAKNSMKTELFKDVGLRSFGFNYKFAPKNQAEANVVEKIVKWFKYTAHPDYNGPNNGLVNYPFVFNITHFITDANGKAVENTNLPRHTLSVLESVSVTYGNNGFINTFSDGRPTEISLELKFKELFTLTRSDILKGF